MWGHREDTAVCTPRRGASEGARPVTPGPRASHLQEGIVSVCGLSHPSSHCHSALGALRPHPAAPSPAGVALTLLPPCHSPGPVFKESPPCRRELWSWRDRDVTSRGQALSPGGSEVMCLLETLKGMFSARLTGTGPTASGQTALFPQNSQRWGQCKHLPWGRAPGVSPQPGDPPRPGRRLLAPLGTAPGRADRAQCGPF